MPAFVLKVWEMLLTCFLVKYELQTTFSEKAILLKLRYSEFSVVSVSSIYHSDSVIHTYIFFRSFSLMGYYKTLNRVPCAIQ